MKVLIISTKRMGQDGLTSVLMNYVRNTNHAVQYDLMPTGEIVKEYQNEVQQIFHNVVWPPYLRLKKPLRYLAWARKQMCKNKYDVIHIHGNSGTMFLEVFAAKLAGVPVRICHCHSSSSKYRLVHKVLKPLMNRLMTTGIACSDKAAEWVFTQKYILMPNAIDVSRFRHCAQVRAEVRAELGIENDFVIGHLGYMDVEKNHSYLLSVFKQLLKLRENSKLVLIGDGRLRPEIEKRIEEENLQGKVLVLGRRQDVERLYQGMDVFTLPSIFEGLPVSALEAQAAGLRCIVSSAVTRQVNVTGDVEFLDIDEASIPLWVDSLLREYNRDRRECNKIVERSQFNIKNCAKQLLEIYGVEQQAREVPYVEKED